MLHNNINKKKIFAFVRLLAVKTGFSLWLCVQIYFVSSFIQHLESYFWDTFVKLHHIVFVFLNASYYLPVWTDRVFSGLFLWVFPFVTLDPVSVSESSWGDDLLLLKTEAV